MLIFVLLLATSSPIMAQPSESDEGSLRAAVIIGLLRFATCPSSHSINSKVEINIVGNAASADFLKSISGQELIGKRKVLCQAISPKEIISDTGNVLIIGAGVDSSSIISLMEQTRNHAILTICDQCGNGDVAMINVLRRDNRIVFEINLRLAKNKGFGFSSSVLELAGRVIE